MAKVRLEVESGFGPEGLSAFDRANEEVNKLRGAATGTGKEMQGAFQKASGAADNYDKTLKKATASTTNQTGAMQKMVAGYIAGAASIYAVTRAVGDAIRTQKEFEKSLKNLSAITGASGEDLEFYSQQAILLGLNIKGGAAAAVEAFKLLGSAKPELLENKEALVGLTEQAILLSHASGLELPVAAEALGNSLNALNLPARTAGKLVDVLAAAAQKGAKEIPFLSEAFAKFGGVSAQAGVSIQESAAAIEILGAKIPEASIVGNRMNTILINLQTIAAKNGREFLGLSKELELLAPRVKDVTFLTENFQKENVLAIQTLIAEREALAEMTIAVDENGTAMKQAATNTDTLEQATLRAANAYDALVLAFTQGNASNVTKQAIDFQTRVITNLTEIIEGTAASSQAAREISAVTGATDKLARSLIALGYTNKGLRDVMLQIENFSKIDDTDAAVQGVRQLVGYAQALEENITRIQTSNNEEQASVKLKALVNGQLIALKKSFREGAITGEDYTIKLKLISAATAGLFVATKKITETVPVTTGLIAKLKEEIAKLNTEVDEAPDVATINSKLAQLKVKQAELDALLGKKNEDIIRFREDLQKELLALLEKSIRAEISMIEGPAKVEAQMQADLNELNRYKKTVEEKGKLVSKNFKFTAEQEEQFAILESAIRTKAARDIIQIEIDKQKELHAQRIKGNELTLQALEQQEQALIAGVEGSSFSSAGPDKRGEAEFEEAKQRQILAIQKEFAEKKLKQQIANLADARRVQIIEFDKELQLIGDGHDAESKSKREHLERERELMQTEYELQNQVVQTEFQNMINGIQEKLNKLDEIKPFSLAKLLGVTEEELAGAQQFIGSVGESINTIIAAQDKRLEVQQNQLQTEIDLVDQTISERDRNISDLESKLEEELDLKARGIANNTDLVRSQIAQEMAAKEAAIQQQNDLQKREEEIRERRKRAAKLQLAVDTATQASNMITAASTMYAQLVLIDPTAISATIAVAAMVAAFAAQKAALFAEINKGEGFRKGGYTGDIGEGEVAGEVHGREFVHTAEKTRKYRSLFEGIHSDNRALIQEGIFDLLKGTGVELMPNLPKNIAHNRDAIRRESELLLKTDNSRMEKELNSLNGKFTELLKSQQEKRFYDPDGNLVIKRGGHTVIVKKK